MNIDKQKLINEYRKERNKVYNARHVTENLSSEEYSKFWKYCKDNKLNKNSAINKLLNSHPEINGTNTN